MKKKKEELTKNQKEKEKEIKDLADSKAELNSKIEQQTQQIINLTETNEQLTTQL